MKSPSVLVVRSTCLPPSQDSLEEHNGSGDNHANRADVHHSTSDDTTTSVTDMLQQTLHSFPITCDITVLPEIPVDSHISVNDKDVTRHDDSLLSAPHIRLERQALHPCGMDNVLLLRDLPAAAHPASYLLSLSSCTMVVSQVDTNTNGAVLLELNVPLTMSIPAMPSTFSFAFQQSSSSSTSQQSNGIVVNPTSASAELQVVFDLTTAYSSLEEQVLKEKYNDLTTTTTTTSSESVNEKVDATLVQETNVISPTLPLEEPCLADTKQQPIVMRDTPHHDEQLLHVIRELAEKEAQHLDYMLVGLGLVFILLLVHYARTVLPLVRAKKKQRNLRSVASATTGRLVERDTIGGKVSQPPPPVSSVTFHRSSDAKNATVPALLEEQQVTFSTDNGVASSKTPFVASESTIGMAETSSLSSASAREMKQFTFLPTTDYSPTKIKADQENVDPQLSPCSKLKQQWMQTKEQRRVCRRKDNEQHEVISPVAQVVLSPKVLQQSNTGNIPPPTKRVVSPMAPVEMNIPTLVRAEEPVKNSFAASTPGMEKPPRPLNSRERKVMTPETCLVSEESFLQDYWGE